MAKINRKLLIKCPKCGKLLCRLTAAQSTKGKYIVYKRISNFYFCPNCEIICKLKADEIKFVSSKDA